MPKTTVVARKPLKHTDRLKRFAIPTKALPLFPQFNGHHFVPVVFWHGSKPWPMVIYARTRGYKKPVISKGWIPFVRKNQLEVDDVVTIVRDEDEDGARIWYQIEIERRSKPLPAPHRELEEQQVPIVPSSNNVNVGVADKVFMSPRRTPAAVSTAHNSNFNVEVAANIPAIKQETQLAPGHVPPVPSKTEELSLKPDSMLSSKPVSFKPQTPMFAGTLSASPVEEELKSTAAVLQEIAHQTHQDDTKTTNLDPILNKTSADPVNLNLTLAPPPVVVAWEGNQAPTMGLFGTEAQNFNPGWNLDLTLGPTMGLFSTEAENFNPGWNLDLTLAPPKVN